MQEIKNSYGIEINFSNFTAKVNGERVNLTPTEFKVLNILFSDAGNICLRARLEQMVFEERSLTRRNLDVHIHHLRHKLKRFGLTITNSRGLGYCLDRARERSLDAF